MDKVNTPLGGQAIPMSTVGTRDASKKAQKKLTKKNTSDKIKNITPNRMQLSSLCVWNPKKDSLYISTHHKIKTSNNLVKFKTIKLISILCLMSIIKLINNEKRFKDTKSGQRLVCNLIRGFILLINISINQKVIYRHKLNYNRHKTVIGATNFTTLTIIHTRWTN